MRLPGAPFKPSFGLSGVETTTAGAPFKPSFGLSGVIHRTNLSLGCPILSRIFFAKEWESNPTPTSLNSPNPKPKIKGGATASKGRKHRPSGR